MDEKSIWYRKDETEQKISCDTVILAVGFVSNRELEEQLRKGGGKVTTVGDAQLPRKIGTAVREGMFAVLDME